MRVIVAGSRDLLDPYEVEEAIVFSAFPITELVCGMARGVDMNAYLWAKRNGVAVREMPAIWRDKDGVVNMRAGPERNQRMADCAEALIAVWDGVSPGTRDMIARAKRRNLPVELHTRKVALSH